MKKAFNIAVLMAAAACATAPPIPLNRYGLPVIRDVATYERLAGLDEDKRLVDLERFVPGIAIDIRYATEDNFMKKRLYPVARAWLRRPAALALRDIQRELAADSLGLKVWDAYRPYRVTEEMWEPIRNPDYVADPAKGSRHNRGAAVDLTFIDLRTGADLSMPTAYDDFTKHAAHDYSELSKDVLANRARLRDVMIRHGFEPLPSEWWHYDFSGWQRFEILDVDLRDLAPEND
jgi:D-alanyl-D-alanine dipeptidase